MLVFSVWVRMWVSPIPIWYAEWVKRLKGSESQHQHPMGLDLLFWNQT